MAKIPDIEGMIRDRPATLAGGGGIQAAKPIDPPRLGQEAEGVMAVAKALGNVSGDVANVVVREQDRTDTMRAEDAYNKLRSDQLDLTLGDDNGFINQKGENAVSKPILKEWTDKFDQKASQIAETLGNERQREMFQHRAGVARQSYEADIYRHVAGERDKYAQAVLKNTIDTEVRAVGASPDNEEDFKASVDRVMAAQDREGDRLGYVGKKKVMTDQEKAKSLDLLWTARWDAWRLKDPREAMRNFQDNQNVVSPDARRRIEEGLFRDVAPVLAAGLNQNGGAPIPARALVQAAERDFDQNFNTRLTPKEEAAFQVWKEKYAPNDSGVDYDLRGAFKAGVKPAGPEAGKDEGHFPDTFKKPNHPTFSDESRYAPFGKPGRWQGDKFTPWEQTPRGLRNNNPGNIIQGERKWDGQIEGADPKYATFATPEGGIRAMTVNLISYQNQGIDTVAGIIGRWAPATENATDEYVKTVASKLGVDPREPLNLRDRKVMTNLVNAIIDQENGKNPYSAETVTAGVDAGLSGRPFAYEAKRSALYSMASISNLTAGEAANITTGDPVVDRLPLDQKIKVFQLAKEQSNQGMAQVRDAMKQRLLDATSAYEAGKDAPAAPTRVELIAAFGQLDGERLHGDLDLSRQFGEDVKSVQTLPTTQQAALIAARSPQPGPGFAMAERRHEMLVRAVDTVNKQREQDPAKAVMQSSPQVAEAYRTFAQSRSEGTDQQTAAQAYAAASLAEQIRLEVRNPQIMSKDMVDGIARQFAQPPAQGENLANVMRGMSDTWGRFFPQVIKQLQGRVPPEAIVIGLGVKPEAEMALSETARLKPEAMNQGIPKDQSAALSDHLRAELEPLRRTLSDQFGGTETYDNFYDSATKIGLLMMQKGEKPKVAAQKAAEALFGFKYEFEGTWRVPKEKLGGETTMSALRWGAEAIKRDIASEKPVVGEVQSLALPRIPAAVRPEDAMKQWRRDVEANGYWVTSQGDGGLTLYITSGMHSQVVRDAGGKPITRSWQEVSDIGNSVRAAYAKDVYKKGVRQP